MYRFGRGALCVQVDDLVSPPGRQGGNNFRLRLMGKLLLSAPGATPEDLLSSKEVASFIQRVWPG